MVLGPPSPVRWAAEVPRLAWTIASIPGAWPGLMKAPRGDGRPVMVLPGLGNSDRSSVVLRRYLAALGYRAEGWGLGRNLGVRAVGAEAERLIERVRDLHGRAGPVTLVGVSLGGIMARLVAHRAPDLVREVITVSAPYAGDPRATNVWRAFEWLSGERIDSPAVIARSAEAAAPPPVPTTAIWSASDGLVNGLLCRDDQCRAIEIRSSHMGVQMKPATLRAIADVLAGR
ncbi:esterase/lipase family protein [uncultured Sphingomonas sp.]|uniref:esterase/lipase family protein n=1 Tax=uncultured Sphingomonas sp. TaxID=158754 RepID=UPI0035CB7141